ncbi:hypothetical protein ABLV54_26795, partial [Klebsiella sp. JB_Kp042]|uniref:hypothetical protein n=1 Tax=Klebsiella sp. JB_Kp042 TaxID=3153394 RepID=UPI0032B44D6B
SSIYSTKLSAKVRFIQQSPFLSVRFLADSTSAATAGTFVSLTRPLTLPCGERQRFPLSFPVAG